MCRMQTGKYIKNRLLPQIVRAISSKKGLSVDTYSDDWVIKIANEEEFIWVYGYHFDINNGAANEIANDKVATYLTLSAADIPAVSHYLVRSAAREDIKASDVKHRIADTAQPFVIKPLTGSSGQNLQYVEDLAAGVEVVRRSGEAAWAASPYENIAKEFRVIVLDERAELIYEKTQPVIKGRLRLFNLGLGAKAQDITDAKPLSNQLSELAILTCRTLKLRLAAVDIVQLDDEKKKILEVNSGISFEHYGRQSQAHFKKAEQIYEKIIDRMFKLETK